MNKFQKLLLSAAALAALVLTVVLFVNYRGLNQRAAVLSVQLAESRSAWEKTAEEKETLQKDLKVIQNELKEAELTIKESRERSEELKKDIELLKQEIAALTEKKPPAE